MMRGQKNIKLCKVLRLKTLHWK